MARPLAVMVGVLAAPKSSLWSKVIWFQAAVLFIASKPQPEMVMVVDVESMVVRIRDSAVDQAAGGVWGGVGWGRLRGRHAGIRGTCEAHEAGMKPA